MPKVSLSPPKRGAQGGMSHKELSWSSRKLCGHNHNPRNITNALPAPAAFHQTPSKNGFLLLARGAGLQNSILQGKPSTACREHPTPASSRMGEGSRGDSRHKPAIIHIFRISLPSRSTQPHNSPRLPGQNPTPNPLTHRTGFERIPTVLFRF